MKVIERVALTFAFGWTLMDAFLPNTGHQEKLQTTLIVTASIGYLYGLHGIIFNKVRRFFTKKY